MLASPDLGEGGVIPPDRPLFRFQRDLPVEERAAYLRRQTPSRATRSTPYANPQPAALRDDLAVTNQDPLQHMSWMKCGIATMKKVGCGVPRG